MIGRSVASRLVVGGLLENRLVGWESVAVGLVKSKSVVGDLSVVSGFLINAFFCW